MKWARVVKLGRPVRTLEIELLWRLREPCQFGHSSKRIGPVDIQSDLRRISVRHGCYWFYRLHKSAHTRLVSSQCPWSRFMRPLKSTTWGIPCAIEGRSVRNTDLRN